MLLGLAFHSVADGSIKDLDACLWTPERYELTTSPSAYCSKRGGVIAGRDTVLWLGCSPIVLSGSNLPSLYWIFNTRPLKGSQARPMRTRTSKRRGGAEICQSKVSLFPGAQSVLQRLCTDATLSGIQIAVASSTTAPRRNSSS